MTVSTSYEFNIFQCFAFGGNAGNEEQNTEKLKEQDFVFVLMLILYDKFCVREASNYFNKTLEEEHVRMVKEANDLLKLDSALDDSKAREEAYLQLPLYGGNGLATNKLRFAHHFSDAIDCLSWHGCTTQAEQIALILDGTADN